jgi:hypothetical protein
MLDVLANPQDTEYEDTKVWIESMKGGSFDPEQFDPKVVVFEDPAKIFELCFSR